MFIKIKIEFFIFWITSLSSSSYIKMNNNCQHRILTWMQTKIYGVLFFLYMMLMCFGIIFRGRETALIFYFWFAKNIKCIHVLKIYICTHTQNMWCRFFIFNFFLFFFWRGLFKSFDGFFHLACIMWCVPRIYIHFISIINVYTIIIILMVFYIK